MSAKPKRRVAKRQRTNEEGAFLIRAGEAIRYGAYSGPVDTEVVQAARQVASAWSDLARALQKRRTTGVRLKKRSKR